MESTNRNANLQNIPGSAFTIRWATFTKSERAFVPPRTRSCSPLIKISLSCAWKKTISGTTIKTLVHSPSLPFCKKNLGIWGCSSKKMNIWQWMVDMVAALQVKVAMKEPPVPFFMQTIVTLYFSSHKLEYLLKGKCTKTQWNSRYLDLNFIIWLKFYD